MEVTINIPFVDGIAEHIKKHKTTYMIGISILVIGGIIYYIGISPGSTRVGSPSASIFGINNKIDQRVTTLVDRPGPPSWIIGKVGTDEAWLSQHAAAFAEGIGERDLRAHLNGFVDNINGERYYRKGLAAV